MIQPLHGKLTMIRATLLLLIVMAPLLFSCSMRISATSYQDRTIPAVSLSKGKGSTTWRSPDLIINVGHRIQKGTAAFTGELNFDSSVLLSFPVVERFALALLIQDRQGRTLQRRPIRLGIIHYQFAEETYRFDLQTRLPEMAVAYTFEYEGSFSDYGEIRPDTIYIAYHPPRPPVKAGD